jgi:hypothetical protein
MKQPQPTAPAPLDRAALDVECDVAGLPHLGDVWRTGAEAWIVDALRVDRACRAAAVELVVSVGGRFVSRRRANPAAWAGLVHRLGLTFQESGRE